MIVQEDLAACVIVSLYIGIPVRKIANRYGLSRNTIYKIGSNPVKYVRTEVLEYYGEKWGMTRKIIDEFTDLPISRQRKYQLRHPEKLQEVQTRYKERHPDRVRAFHSKWTKRNQDRIKAYRLKQKLRREQLKKGA